jgi:signal transduction histidine kinase
MSTVVLVLALAVLGAGIVAALIVRVLPSLQSQLAALAILAVCLPLGTVLASGLVMFGMHGSGKIAAVAIVSTLAALGAALLLGRRFLRPLDQVRAASKLLAGGDLSARAPESGPRELRDVAGSFNEMAASVERLFDARRELVAWASHDLRTPLASLRAMVEALEDGLATPEEYLPAIRSQTEILSRLVDDLFELARLDAGALTLELREAPLGNLVSSCVGALKPEARAHNVRLESRIDPADPAVWIAPDKIERVLLNLLTNAVRHARPDGCVAIIVEPDGDHVVVAVEDDGTGLAPGASERMFERFWRDDGSRTRASGGGGAGLGLAISQGLVEAHGGTIWAENRAGGGARVTFTLPLARHAAAVGS